MENLISQKMVLKQLQQKIANTINQYVSCKNSGYENPNICGIYPHNFSGVNCETMLQVYPQQMEVNF
uniref:Uncharacterized protein n=1 Tax=Strongyloides venezuelensis TaxID=75913 RepID=A0A0K0FLU7_STRVS